MMVNEMFKYAGVSRLNGRLKVRYANTSDRPTVLEKNGHTDIKLISLPFDMEKLHAVQHLIDIQFSEGSDEIQQTLIAERDKQTDKAGRIARREQRAAEREKEAIHQ